MGKNKTVYKIIYWILSILTFAFFAVLAIIPQRFRYDGLVFTMLPAICAFVICIKNATGKKVFETTKFKNVIIPAVIGLLYEIMLSVTALYGASFTPMSEYLEKHTPLSQGFALIAVTAGFVVASFICVFIVADFLMNDFCRKRETAESDENALYVKVFRFRINRYILPIFILTVLFVIAGFWGYSHPDVKTVYEDATTNNFNQWHTVCYELFVKACLTLFGAKHYLASVMIVQGALCILVQNYVINVLADNFKTAKACAFYTTSACIIISPLYYTQLVIKDPLFCVFLLGFTAAIFDFVKCKNPRLKHYLYLGIMGAGASLFRHIIIYIVIATFLVLFVCQLFILKEKKKSALKILAAALIPIIAFTGLSTVLGDHILHAKQNPKHVTYTIPLYLCAAVAEQVGRDGLDDETEELLDSMVPVESWAQAYVMDIYWADTVSRDWSYFRELVNEFDKGTFLNDILKANIRLLFNHPKEYLTALFNITSLVWEISTPGPDGYVVVVGDSEGWEGKITRNSGFQATWPTLKATIDNPILNPFLWRGGIWIIIGVFSAMILIKKKRYKELLAFVPVFLYAASLMVSCPAQDPRYVVSFMQIGIFMITVSRFEKTDDTTENRSNSK